MVTTVDGVYRNGRIDLEQLPDQAEGSRVVVTFLPSDAIDLREKGIDATHAADLRRRLAAFGEDWDRPEMSAYDELPSR